MAHQQEITSLVGHFLSASDETALLGVSRILQLSTSAAGKVTLSAFLEDAHSVDSFIGLLARAKMDVAPVFEASAALLGSANKASKALLLRLLCGATPRQRIRGVIHTLSDKSVQANVAALHLLTAMVEANSKQTMSKFGKQIPLKCSAFTDALTFVQTPVRAARTRFVVAVLNSRHVEVTMNAAMQIGMLTRLADDLFELSKKDTNTALVQSAIAAITSAVFGNDALTSEQKRKILVAQRGSLKSLVGLLGATGVADVAASLLRRIVGEVAEAARDYSLSRDTEDTRMPNYALLLLLRHLRPKHRALDSHLVVYILHRCPDLYRPYLQRVAKHLPEADNSLPVARASVAVCNLLSRLFMCPVAGYLTTHSGTVLDATAAAEHFFDVTPETAADEVLPPWFGEAAHRTLNASGNSPLMFVFILQCCQAAIHRASAVKRCIHAVFAEQQRRHVSRAEDLSASALPDDANSLLLEDAFMSRFDAILQDRLARREVIQPYVSKFVAMSVPADAGAAVGVESPADTKAQFIVQRAYAYFAALSTLFRWRLPWTTVLPTPQYSWSPMEQSVRCLRLFNPTSVRCLCALILNNLSRQVKLPKLVHIDFGATAAVAGKAKGPADSSNDATRPPLLLELLYWSIASREHARTAGVIQSLALRAVCDVVQATVQASVAGSSVAPEEVGLWLRVLTPDDAVLLVHSVGYVAQLNEKNQAPFIDNAEHGFLAASARGFVARQREKAAAGPSATAQSIWQLHTAKHLDAFVKFLDKIEKRWSRRNEIAAELFGDLEPASETHTQATGAHGGVATLDTRSRLLRRAAADAAAVDDTTTLVRFLSHRALPSAIAEAALQEHGDCEAPLSGSPESLAAWCRRRQGWHSSRCGPWLVALGIMKFRKVSTMTPAEREAAVGAVSLACDGATNSVDVARGERLSVLGVAVCLFAVARGMVLYGVAGSKSIEPLRDACLALYGGTLSATDRALFAALALIDDVTTVATKVVDEDDVNDSKASGDSSSSSGDDDAADHGDAESKPMPSRTAPKRHRAEQPKSKVATVVALRSLRQARFLVGGASTLAASTPEVEILTSIVESMTDRDIATLAIRMPMRITTPSSQHAARHPLQLVFPDVTDGDGRGPRWYNGLPSPTGAVEPSLIDPVTGAVFDPRYFLPLYYTVTALRFRHAASVAGTTVTRLVPVAVRGLSLLDPALRELAVNCLALQYRSLHPIPRLVVNSVRLQMQQRGNTESDAIQRLGAAQTAHYTLSFGPISNPQHPLFAACTSSLSLADDLAVPLEDMLSTFPASAVIGLPIIERPGEVATSPELRHVLEQLRYSCGSWSDFVFMNRRHVLQKLCINAGLFLADVAFRKLLLSTIEALTVGHCTTDPSAHDIVVPWCLQTLMSLCSEAAGAKSFEAPASEIVELLRRVYVTYHAPPPMHRRTVTTLLATLRFSQAVKVASGDLMCDALHVIATAWHHGAQHSGFVEERTFIAELLAGLRESGIAVDAAVFPALSRLAKEVSVA